jgi:hypothetical protein
VARLPCFVGRDRPQTYHPLPVLKYWQGVILLRGRASCSLTPCMSAQQADVGSNLNRSCVFHFLLLRCTYYCVPFLCVFIHVFLSRQAKA